MLDSFLEVSFGHTKEASERAQTVELLKKLPNELLFKLATGQEKLAYGSPTSIESKGESEGTWLSQFHGTPLFEQAVQLEQQDLEAQMARQQRQQEDSASYQEQDQRRDQLSIQRKMLELELATSQNGGGGGEELPVPQEAPAQEEVSAAPPAPENLKEEEGGGKAPPVAVKVGSLKEAAILMKAAYLSESDNDWLSNFAGTPLFDKALQLEEAMLANEAQEIQDRQARRQTDNYEASDQLRLQKRQLSLELAKQQAGGGGGEAEAEVAPAEEAPPPPPPGPPAPPAEAEVEKASSRMKLARAKMKIASGARYEDLTELEKKAFGAAMLAGLKGMGQFAAGTGKNVMQAARGGGGIKAVGQTLGGAARMGATQAANFAKKNPMAAAGLAAGGIGAAGLGGMALGRATS